MENQSPPAARSPVWIPIVRGIQVLLSLIIFGLSADLIHGKYFNSLGFAIFCALITWLIVAYNLLTEFNASLASLRNQLVVMGADAVMVIFWLSAMGASAALRSSFKYAVDVEACYNNGAAIDSSTCVVGRGLEKRAAVATKAGLSMMSAVAGLSALEILLFIACLAYYVRAWFQGRSKTAQTGYDYQQTSEGYPMSTAQQPYVQQQPQTQQPYVQQQYPQQPHVQQQYNQQPYGQQVPYSMSPPGH